MTIVGKAIRDALDASQDGVAHPTDWKAVLQPLLNGAKIKNWKTLQESASMVGVEMSDSEFHIVPSRNGGAKGNDKGYQLLPEKAIVLIVGCSTGQLGFALSRALELCC